MGGVVAMEKGEFVGKAALAPVAERGPSRRLRGLRINGRGIPRDHYPVTTAWGEGVVTSGTFSPTLKRGIAMAFVPPTCEIGECVSVEIRRPGVGRYACGDAVLQQCQPVAGEIDLKGSARREMREARCTRTN